jgi:PAS domain-containing protein
MGYMTWAEINAPSGAHTAANKEIMYEFDLVTGDLTWSDALYNTLGYERSEPFSKFEWWISHIHPDDAMLLNHAMDALTDTKVPFWRIDYRFRKGDGSYVAVQDRASILRNEKGEAIRLIGTLTPTA